MSELTEKLDCLGQREVLGSLEPDFARDNQSEESYIEAKREQVLRFVDEYTTSSGAAGWVIGISGGIDSFLVGALLAENAASTGRKLLALLLPNGEQSDIADAQACADTLCRICRATIVETVNIENGYKGALKDLAQDSRFDAANRYQTGNLQPRLRMMYQYALGNGLLVAGTDHATEAVTGFYTKYGDGGVDFNPVGDMVKDDIRAMAKVLGAPQSVLDKAPAAGLGISATDEEELGITYDNLCRYLKGWRVSPDVERAIEAKFAASAHKRQMPPTPAWLYRMETPATHIHCGDAMANETVEYINEHPCQHVLYVGVREPGEYVARVHKTVNSPLKRYNMFEMGEGTAMNADWGSLVENVEPLVWLTGDQEMCAKVAGLLGPLSGVREVSGCIG